MLSVILAVTGPLKQARACRCCCVHMHLFCHSIVWINNRRLCGSALASSQHWPATAPAHYVIVFISTALQAMRSASLFLRHCNWWCSRRVNSRCSWSCPHTSHRSGDSAWLIEHVACSISSMALRVLHRLAYIFKGCLYCLWSELRFHFCQRSCSCGRTAVQQLQ